MFVFGIIALVLVSGLWLFIGIVGCLFCLGCLPVF